MKNLLNKIKTFFLWLIGSAKKGLEKYARIGIIVTNAIKKFDDKNPLVADLITSLIPGDLDDRIKAKIRKELPKVVIQLGLVNAAAGLTDPDEILVAASDFLQTIKSDYAIREGHLNNLAIVIAQIASDGKLTWDDAVYLVKQIFDKEFRN